MRLADSSLFRMVASYLVFAMFIIGIAPRAEAGFSPSAAVAVPQVDRGQDLQKIQEVLEMKMVRQRLEQLGFTQAEIQSRLSQMGDQQIHRLALNLDKLKAAGDDGFGFVIGLLVVVILVLVILQLTGHRVIVR